MLARLGRLDARFPWWVVGTWAVLVAGAFALALVGIGGEGLFDRVTTGAPMVAGSDSQVGADRLAAADTSGTSVTLAVTDVDVQTTGLADAFAPSRTALAAIPGVESVVDPFALPGGVANPSAAGLVADEGTGFLVVVELRPDLGSDGTDRATSAVAAALREVPTSLHGVAPAARGLVGSDSLIVSAITDQVRADLRTGELIALPVALVVMVAVFGSLLAASLPVVGALASIAGGLVTLLGLSHLMDVDAAVINVVTVLGLGLSIDYGLLVATRYREELHRLLDDPVPTMRARPRGDAVVAAAIERTVATAGRTVAFSAVTVALAVAGLLVFRPAILRAIGAAGAAVVLVALATALTLVPALLRLTGRRLHRPSRLVRVPGVRWLLARTSDVRHDEGVFSRLAARVQRHPWWWLGGSLALLLALAWPASGMQLRNSGIELLPASSDQRAFVDLLAAQYPAATEPAVVVVAQTSLDDATAWAPQLAGLPGVASVDQPRAVGDLVRIGVRTTGADAGSRTATDVVTRVRALHPGFAVWVTGEAANQVDFLHAVRTGLPWAALVVVLGTWLLMFLMTGSVVLGLKTLLTNGLTLGASLGVLTWVFQGGHLAGLLGFTPVGGVETYVVVMVVAFAFGLAMDYEVFLLARVLELHRAGLDDATAVRLGLQRSARIITSAAAIIVVVFGGFVAGRLLVIKEVGFTLAVAVAIDATVVRMLLVPATMSLLGRWNWWSPAPLRSLHERFAVRH